MSKEIEWLLRQTLTVQEIREALEDWPDDAPVLFHCDYGDHSHTEQALAITEIEIEDTDNLRESGYSQSQVAYQEPEDRTTNTKPVVFLS